MLLELVLMVNQSTLSLMNPRITICSTLELLFPTAGKRVGSFALNAGRYRTLPTAPFFARMEAYMTTQGALITAYRTGVLSPMVMPKNGTGAKNVVRFSIGF